MGAQRRWWLLAILAALPVLIVPVVPMADLPNHIARHRILAQALFDGGSPWWRVDWRWIGNLGVDLPAVLLSPVLGIEGATRLIIAAIAPLTVLGLVALGRAAHGRVTAGTALALPFALAQPWLYGFANYTLAVALALFVAAAWWRRPADTPRRMAGFALAALGVWSAHVMGWAILLLLIAGAELAGVRQPRALAARAIRAAPLLLPVVPMLMWRAPGAAALFVVGPHPVAEKVAAIATILKGLWLPFDLAMLAIVALLAGTALATARSPWLEPRLAFATALSTLAFALLPATVLGSWGADLRLAPVVAMIALVAIRPGRSMRLEQGLVFAGAALLLVRIAVTAWIWTGEQSALAARLALLDAVPGGSRLGYVVAAPACGAPWRLDVDRKLGSYAVTRRDAFANTLFLIPGADIVHRRRAVDARWFDGTQDLACDGPARALADRMEAFAAARFEAIWVAGAPARLTAPAGFHVARAAAGDVLLVRDGLQ